MKLLLTVVALVAVAQASPISTHTMEIGANGVASGSVPNVPLVEIIVNMIKDAVQAVAPETVNEPVYVPEPIIVVDEAQNLPAPGNPVDVITVNPEPANPIDVISVNPDPGNPIDVISVNPVPEPIVLPEPTPAEVVPAPIVLPEPTPAEVVPSPIVLPEPTPAEVVPSPIVIPEPTPAEVIEAEPVQVVEVAPETPSVASEASGSQIINVMMNFIFGDSGSLSSVEVPAHVIPQIVGAPRA